MEGKNWMPAQGDVSMADASSVDWRTQLQPDARQRIVNKIMETLKRHLPISVPEGLNELRKIAIRFEEKIYTAATSQSDYLRKISLKMLSMETKTQSSPSINQTIPSAGAVGQNSADPGSHNIQPQANNPGQQLPVPNRQSLLPQNFQNASAAAIQGSSGLAPALQSISGLSQSNISGVTQVSNLQNMSGMSQGQGAQSDIYSGAQRQMHERQQQQILAHQQQQPQQQSQNQLMYNRQMQQQQLIKQNLQHSSLLPQHMAQQQQQQQQQQSLLPPNQLQSSQQQMMPGLQPNQNILQSQAANIQVPSQSGVQQNQLNQIQPGQSLMQQNSVSVARQQQAQQPPLQQQSIAMSHPSTLSQQQQLIGQQNSISDIQQQQQQRLPMQNNLLLQQQQHSLNQQSMSLHQQQQQQLGSQSNVSGLQQQQQQHSQLLGSLPNVSNMPPHQRTLIMQKNAAHQQQLQQQHQQQQQQNQQSSLSMSQSQGQSQHQASQQQLMSQFQSQPTQMQQQLIIQQQSNSLQREMQQRLQASNTLLQAQNTMEQKQLIQTQRGLPEGSSSTSVDSTAQTGHAGVGDPQEECFQKIKSMKDMYYGDLNEFHQEIALKLQQQEALLPPGKQSDQYDKLKGFKIMLERMLALLQISKNKIPAHFKEKLPIYEKQLLSLVAPRRSKKVPPVQQQFQHSSGNSLVAAQQQTSQVSQQQLPDNHVNLVQQINMPAIPLQSAGASSMQHVSMPLSATQQSMPNTLQQNSNMDSVQSSFSSGQPGSIGSGQQVGLGSLQNSMNTPHQNNLNTLSQSAVNTLQPNVSSMQPGSSVLQQQQQLKQQQQEQLLKQQQQEQLLKQQLQQRHMQQQQHMIHQQRQQLLQQHQQQQQQQPQQQQPLQQHLLQQQKQQQTSPLPGQQLLSINELNDPKVRQVSGIKPALHDYQAGQRHNFYSQQLKQGAGFPVSSPQNLQVSSPQISHQSSPQIDHNGFLSSVSKVKGPVHSANSPLVVTPSTPFAPSPIPVDSDKPVSTISSIGNLAPQQPTVAPTQPHSLAVSTPGISASPLLAECISQDGNLANVPATSRTSATERPVERLIKMVQSLTPKVLSSSVEDIGSVVSMVDRIAGSAPGNGSRAAVGEDLVAMTKCRLQARNFMSQDGGATAKKMKRHTSAMPLNNMSSAGSVNDSFKQLHGFETSELESTATSRIKRIKPEINQALLEEIREINQSLIDTVVDISDEDADSFSASETGEGTVIKCSYTAVALSPDLKAHFAAAQMSPIMPLRLLAPANYPKCSPVVLDKLPVETSSEFEDLSSKAKSKFNISLRCLSQPMSLGEMARTWDTCARKVILEYAQQAGGGSFSSRYGSWGNCVTA